jgi:NADH-quinone oxidoreductase subunit N
LFYALTYVLTTLGTFGVLLLLSRQDFEAEHIHDLKGLNQRHPWWALITLLLMFSLAGIPPTVGFYAKLAVLQALVDAGMTWLAVIAVLTSLIGAFYYLRIVKVMYFEKPEAPLHTPDKQPSRALRQGVLSLNGGLILVLGLLPGAAITLCVETVRLTLAY